MIEIKSVEDSLVHRISSDDLKNSLSQIRKSAAAIWADDAPRIIHNFTGHGINHSLRLINFASKLLNANKGKPFSDEELYLLIAGIYLHDIGMQCDVIKYPEILEKAVGFGAIFKIDFLAKNASDFSIKEQNEIRKNHHFLSAAWINYAFHSSETVLGKAIKSVPDELVSDLIDICRYYSSLDISTCPICFKLFAQESLQLIASIVRFSDELDVDKNRVSIDTVMNFRIDHQNAFYWWINQSTIIEINENILNIKIRLHPSDYATFGPFVKQSFIDVFKNKNQPVLAILNSNNFAIVLNADSDVISYEYAQKFPDEIVKIIKEMQTKEVIPKQDIKPGAIQINEIRHNYFPKPKPYFAGRTAELLELKETFEKNSFIFIEGGGGIGKTQFVAKFIEDLKLDNKIVWHECTPLSQPDNVIKDAGFEEILKGKEKTEREKYSAFNDKIEEFKLVVFLDNYQEVETNTAFKSFLVFVDEYLRKGHVFVLGRDNIITPQLQPKRITLKGLGKDSLLHAHKLIEHSYPNLLGTSPELLKMICETFKGYPLAIDLAVYLLSLNVPLENILKVAVQQAQCEGSEIEKISNRLLNEIFRRPDASEEEKHFLKLFSIFRGKTSSQEALAIIPQEIFDSASRKLVNRNLLDLNNDYLELHPLIREFCYKE